MSDDAHIIEIDHLVLTGTARYRPDRLRALIEAEMQRVVAGAGIPREVTTPNAEASVAGEVAHSVTQAVRGGER